MATFSETANQLHCSLWNSYIPKRLYSRSEDFGSSLRDSTELLLLQGSFRLQPLLEMPGKLMKFPNTQLVPCFGLKVQGKFRKDISYPEEIFETGKMKKFKSTMRWIFFCFFFPLKSFFQNSYFSKQSTRNNKNQLRTWDCQETMTLKVVVHPLRRLSTPVLGGLPALLCLIIR